MNGPIAQIVALTCHANLFLAGNDIPAFLPGNSTTQFCERVAFMEVQKPFFGKPTEKEVAASPNLWFDYLKKKHAKGIRLLRQPQDKPGISDRMAAGFVGGGGSWVMEVLLPDERSELWMARWEIGNQKAPDRRIWRVTYGLVASGKTAVPPTPPLSERLIVLRNALTEIEKFARSHDLKGFADAFANAIETVDSGEPLHGYHKDLLVHASDHPLAACALDAAQSAWVFGGMGSWNDMSFAGDDGKEYDRVSEQLFTSVNEVICLATNQTQPK